jgi:hypothetical protein
MSHGAPGVVLQAVDVPGSGSIDITLGFGAVLREYLE